MNCTDLSIHHLNVNFPFHLIYKIFRIQGGELFERVIDEDFVLTERSCACFMKQICEAMEYIHSKKVIHLDMKVKLTNFINLKQSFYSLLFQPENVLCISKTGNRIKIIDFGFARRYDPNNPLQVIIVGFIFVCKSCTTI